MFSYSRRLKFTKAFQKHVELTVKIPVSIDINFDVQQSHWQNVVTYSTWGESLSTNALYFVEIPPNTNNLKYLHEYGSGNDQGILFNYNFTPHQWYSVTITRNSQNKEVYLTCWLIEAEYFCFL